MENKHCFDKYGCIYKITNLINNKIYVGQSTRINDVVNRIYQGSGLIIGKAIIKYGWENFKTEILDYAYNQIELNEKEPFYIKKCGSLSPVGYNLRKGGDQGGKHHEETCKKMSKSRKDLKLSYRENNSMYGKGLFLAKDSEGKVYLISKDDERWKNKQLVGVNVGRKFSEETNKKKASKGEKNYFYGKKLYGDKNGMYGKIHNEQTRSRISNSLNNLPKDKCLHCGVERAVYVVKRYHNEKCKFLGKNEIKK